MQFETNKNISVESTKRIAVLGATGSIGRQTLDIIERYPDRYRATVLTAGSRVGELIELARKFRPRLAVIADESKLPLLRDALAGEGIECAAGAEALEQCVDADDIDMVLTATVGYSGLAPTLRAIAAGKDIALANKETLVVAGDLVNRRLKESASRIFPVDSEHSAVAQCLAGEDASCVRRLIITASGGPFRTWPAEKIATAKAADALRHPNWHMGRKITVDSASMVNKAFEIIEAHHLFGIEPARICAVVHPQSIIHSMVEFADGAVKAQLGMPDMRLPIAYALGEASRADLQLPRLTLGMMRELTFVEPDADKWPCLGLAYEALAKGGNTACVINAANEVAVAAFLAGRIRFTDIYRIIRLVMDQTPYVPAPGYADYVATNAEARQRAQALIK